MSPGRHGDGGTGPADPGASGDRTPARWRFPSAADLSALRGSHRRPAPVLAFLLAALLPVLLIGLVDALIVEGRVGGSGWLGRTLFVGQLYAVFIGLPQLLVYLIGPGTNERIALETVLATMMAFAALATLVLVLTRFAHGPSGEGGRRTAAIVVAAVASLAVGLSYALGATLARRLGRSRLAGRGRASAPDIGRPAA